MIYSAMFQKEEHYARAETAQEARRIFARSFTALVLDAMPEEEKAKASELPTFRVSVKEVRQFARDNESNKLAAYYLRRAIDTKDNRVTFRPFARLPSGKVSAHVESFYRPGHSKVSIERENVLLMYGV